MHGGRINPRGWEKLEQILSHLAKRLKTMHGTKLTVAVDASECNQTLTNQICDESLMSGLKKEMDVKVWRTLDDEPSPGFADV